MTDFSPPQAANPSLPPASSAEDAQAVLDAQRRQSANARARVLGASAGQGVAGVSTASGPAAQVVPIRMKSEEDAAQMGLRGGVSSINLAVAERKEMLRKKKELAGQTPAPDRIKNCFVVSREGGKYLAQSSEGGEPEPADGHYIFVTFLDGTTRLSRLHSESHAHAVLAANNLYVAYAGEVEFEHGELKWFSNQSGTYLPPAELHAQSGFDEDKFRPVAA